MSFPRQFRNIRDRARGSDHLTFIYVYSEVTVIEAHRSVFISKSAASVCCTDPTYRRGQLYLFVRIASESSNWNCYENNPQLAGTVVDRIVTTLDSLLGHYSISFRSYSLRFRINLGKGRILEKSPSGKDEGGIYIFVHSMYWEIVIQLSLYLIKGTRDAWWSKFIQVEKSQKIWASPE